MPLEFSPTEISTLLATFPPPLPTKDKPSFLRSRSTQAALISSVDVLQEFADLLRSSESRIHVKDLSTTLGIDQTEWIFDCYDGELIYSLNRQALLPIVEQEKLRHLLTSQATSELVDLTTFATAHDCSLPSVRRLIDHDLSTFSDDKGRLQVYGSGFEKRSKAQIQQMIDNAGTEVVVFDLTLPLSLAEKFARGVVDPSKGVVEVENDRLKFTPSGYDNAIQQKRDEMIEELLKALSTRGLCTIPGEIDHSDRPKREERKSLALELQSRTEGAVLLDGMDESGHGSLEVWTTDALTQRTSAIASHADNAIATFWAARDIQQSESDLQTSFLAQLLEGSPLILSSPHAEPLHAQITHLFAQMEHNDTQRYKLTLQSTLSIPIDLYAASLSRVPDETLHANLDAFYAAHFHREVLPEAFAALSGARLLYPRSRARDVERLQASLAAAQTFTELREAAQKFARKQRVEPASAEALREAQGRVLARAVRGMKGMSRGSDVLQNLIWVLLAERCEGVFVSAGRDTGRMIKLFRAVGGDEGIAGRLDAWREMLKAGKEDKGELEAMREMAAAHV